MQQFSVHLLKYWAFFNFVKFIFYVKGDWHQYDDIICTAPSKDIFQRLKNAFRSEQRKSVVEGKEIAGNIMLDTIFDLLRNWTDINLKNFLIQLKQFFDIYANPFVYEDRQKRWTSLEYGEKEVWKLLQIYYIIKKLSRIISL